jgi:hypothetical protein
VAADNVTSVATGRSMEEIATGQSRVWRSNRPVEQKGLSLLQALKGAKPKTAKKAGART